jgi:hypothetical protein
LVELVAPETEVYLGTELSVLLSAGFFSLWSWNWNRIFGASRSAHASAPMGLASVYFFGGEGIGEFFSSLGFFIPNRDLL